MVKCNFSWTNPTILGHSTQYTVTAVARTAMTHVQLKGTPGCFSDCM